MKKIFILFIIIFLANPVFSAKWKQIEDKAYIDISSVQDYREPYSYEKDRYNRDEKEFWIKSLNDKSSSFTNFEKTYNKKVWYTMSKDIVDCNNKTIATKLFAIYDTNGNIIDSLDIEHILLDRNDIIPETRGEELYNIVCKYLNNKKPEIGIGVIDNNDNNFDKIADSFDPYIDNLYEKVKKQWKPKSYNGKLICKISFAIAKDGRLLHIETFDSSNNSQYDNEAIDAIKYVAPFKPLPKDFDGQSIEFLFTFIN